MGNQTIFNYFFLSGLSDLPALQLPLFVFFLLIYLLTLIWNSLIIVLIVTSSHLHVPMYFFLGNLAGLDLCCSSLTVPRMLFDLHTKIRKISIQACITQVFVFLLFASCEVFLLAVMSYDRYTAICQPLHYTQIMRWKVCVQLMTIVWCLGFTFSLVHTLSALKLTFCGSNIESFFCDLPQLFQISCSDTFINMLLIFLLGGFLGAGSLIMTILSYVYILLYYGSGIFNHFSPSACHYFSGDKVVSVFYTVITPLLNPLIYSLRNQDFKTALQCVFSRVHFLTELAGTEVRHLWQPCPLPLVKKHRSW